MRASVTELRALLEEIEGASTRLKGEALAKIIAVAYDKPLTSLDFWTGCGDDGSDDFSVSSGSWSWNDYRCRAPDISIDAALALVELALPGWCWRVGTCHVSDDAWLCPDWNDPEHGQRLRDEFGGPVHGTIWDHGVDIDRRPPGNPALAVLEALLTALIEIEERALLPDHHQEHQADAAREG